MPIYRLYRLDGAGRIMKAEWLDHESDDSALKEARKRKHSLASELWDRQRLVGRIEPYAE